MLALTLFISVMAFVLLGSFTVDDPLPIGSMLPGGDVLLKTTDGSAIVFKEAKKKNGLLVMFSCNTCPYFMKNQGRTNAIGAYAQSSDVGIVILNSNEGNRNSEDS